MSTNKVIEFFDKIMDKSVEKIIVSKKGDGYVLFGRFYVTNKSPGIYQVIDVNYNQLQELSTLKNAIAWASLINCKQHHLARRLAKLDLKMHSIELEMRTTKKLYKTAEDKEIQWLKFHDMIYNRRLMQREINEIVNTAKIRQTHKFSTYTINKNFKYWR